MNLKGYQWLNDDNKVIMSFTFKDLTLDVWEDVSIDEYHKFIEFIRSEGMEPHMTDQHYHKIVGLSD